MSNKDITIQDLNETFKNYMKRDNEWKRKIEEQLKPLLADRLDNQIIQKYGVLTFKIIVAIIGFFISIFILCNLIIGFFKR